MLVDPAMRISGAGNLFSQVTRNASRSISSQSPKNGGAQIDTRRHS